MVVMIIMSQYIHLLKCCNNSMKVAPTDKQNKKLQTKHEHVMTIMAIISDLLLPMA